MEGDLAHAEEPVDVLLEQRGYDLGGELLEFLLSRGVVLRLGRGRPSRQPAQSACRDYECNQRVSKHGTHLELDRRTEVSNADSLLSGPAGAEEGCERPGLWPDVDPVSSDSGRTGFQGERSGTGTAHRPRIDANG